MRPVIAILMLIVFSSQSLADSKKKPKRDKAADSFDTEAVRPATHEHLGRSSTIAFPISQERPPFVLPPLPRSFFSNATPAIGVLGGAIFDTVCDEPQRPNVSRRMSTAVIRLKHALAKDVASQLSAFLQRHKRIRPVSHGLVVESQVVIVPEIRTNSLIITAGEELFPEIKKQIALLDQAPRQYHIDMKITQAGASFRPKTISHPQILTTAGRTATVQIDLAGGKTIQIELMVREAGKERNTRPRAAVGFPQRARTIANANQPRVFSPPARTAPIPRQKAAIRRIGALAPPSPSRVKVVREEAEEVLLWLPRAMQTPFIVTTYPIADLLTKKQHGNVTYLHGVDALIGILKATVRPESWKQSGGDGSIRFFESSLSLVIRQSPRGQKQIAELLRQLRRIRQQNR